MAKLKAPLLSLASSGSIGGQLTLQKRFRGTMARHTPIPSDPKSLPQIYHRWDYQDCSYLWHALTSSQKQQWEATARPFHITGFNLWMRTQLLTLPNIAGRWHLDEPQGSVAYDSGKNGNNGTIYGATHTAGYISLALNFDGLDDYVAIPHTPTLNPTIVSVEAWIYPKTVGISEAWCRIIEKRYTTSYYLGLTSSGTKLKGIFANSISPFGTLESTTILVANKWYHVVITHNGITDYLYVNGILEASQPNTVPLDSNIQLTIGRESLVSAYFFHGIIDQAVIYNRALSATEVKIHKERRYPV